MPKSQWSRDWSRCKHGAEGRAPAFDDDRDKDSPFREYDRDQDKQRIDAAVTACMIGLGYTQAAKGE